MEKEKKVFEHDHPLTLMDLWLEQLKHEEDEEEEEEEDKDDLIVNQDFQCLCSRCREEISWYQRYYYSCTQCSDYTVHKFCAELPESVEDICDVDHTLGFCQMMYVEVTCDICGRLIKSRELFYRCPDCLFYVDVICVTKRLQKNIIHHPSHKHPLVCTPKQILAECDACGKEHKGFFYHCTTCARSNFIHSHCAFLPKTLQIQHTTNDVFSHIHPLTLAYSFPYEDRESKHDPRCRVCFDYFEKSNLWIYKCEKCRYYTHMVCATSREEPFMSILSSRGTGKIFKNYEDSQHPNLLHLPFPDPSYSILKHLFFKEDIRSSTCKTQNHIYHQHPLILEDARCIDIRLIPTSSRIKPIPYHDPMKKIELLCDGCVRPITSGPIYMCANEKEDHCNFVLHEWCSRLPKLQDHPGHTRHTLKFHSKIPGKFFGVFDCDICGLPCNGFVYCCDICNYHIDVTCAFLPKEITHSSHPNHLLSRKDNQGYGGFCGMCFRRIRGFSFYCHSCDFHLHPKCALLIPETTTHNCDKHSMKLSYFPIENHISDYFCEVCENEFDPKWSFYHCRECMQSMHTACAPSILQYETYTTRGFYEDIGVHKFVNVKFGGTYMNTKVHPHPLSFVQGIENDGECSLVCDDDDDDDDDDECSLVCYNRYKPLQYSMIFKCLDCKFAIHYECCERMNNRYI